MAKKEINFDQLRFQTGQVFTPAAPINSLDLFAGRIDQIVTLINVFHERGRHAVMFGERGVGKTSLANIMHERLGLQHWVRVACTNKDDFSSIWIKVFKEIPYSYQERTVGFAGKTTNHTACLADLIDNHAAVSVDQVVGLIKKHFSNWFFVLDEFDRLVDGEAKKLTTDVIKGVSDAGSSATIVVVGVGDDVEQLLLDHPSIERNLAQIRMPSMSREELADILTKAWKKLGMSGTNDAKLAITQLSQGFPHYTHLIGKHATLDAILGSRVIVEKNDVINCLGDCIHDVQQSLKNSYVKATDSSQKGAKFRETLLACALTSVDEMGMFRAADVGYRLSLLRKSDVVQLQSYITHLGKFCQSDRGSVLSRSGDTGRVKYRFTNPLMRAFVVMRGVNDGLINATELARLAG